MWDATQYLKYADERARPFADLLARVRCEHPGVIADLGCGTGHLTRTLAERWPAARVVGVDSSPDMLAQASAEAIPGRLTFMQADIMTWSPGTKVDLVVSNAAFQWVNDHEALLARLRRLLAPGGTLGVQMPYQFESPAYVAIDEAKRDPRWCDTLAGVGLTQHSVLPLGWYVERLLACGFAVDAWQTIYLHILTGDNPVLEWFKGSALRPLLDRLHGPLREEFLNEVGRRLRDAYPPKGDVTLLPFPRLFFVAASTE